VSEAREPQNAAAQALAELQAMRGVNQTLRSAPPPDDPGPLTDEQAIEEFRRDTGYIINSNGEVVGRDPNWRPPAEQPPLQYNPTQPASQPAAAPTEEEPMFWRKEGPFIAGSKFKLSQVKGIDLTRGLVVVDKMTYPLSEAEIANVARFALEVMARDLQRQIMGLAKEYGVDQSAPEVKDEVPQVPGDGPKTDGPVGVQAVRDAVQGEPAPVDGDREGGEAPAAS
jgi:hypothetical protein